MTLASRSRKVFRPELWDRDSVKQIKPLIEASGEKLCDHIEQVIDEGKTYVRLTDMSVSLMLAREYRSERLKNVYPNLLGYTTTAREMQQSLGLRDFYSIDNRVKQIGVLDVTHIKPCKTETGAVDYKLSAYAAWLVVSLMDNRVQKRDEFLNIYSKVIA